MPLLLLKLPADVHTKLAAFVRADDAARFCFAGKEAYKAFGIQQWRACLYATHGGLRIGAEPSGLHAARRLATCGRGCLGFRALATDGGTFDGGDSRFWVDALFRPEPWRIYCSRQTSDPILCAATFLPQHEAEDVDSRDRHWMCELIIETWSLEQLQVEPFSSKDYALGSVFLRVCHGLRDEDVVSLNLQNAQEAITKYRAKILEIVQRFNATGAPAMRIGLDKTVFAQRGSVSVDARIEALTSNATAVATTLIVRRPIPVTCPGRLGIVFGCRRAPRVGDLDGRLRRVCADATPYIRALVDGPSSHILSRGPRVELGRRLGGVRPVLLQASCSPEQGVCYQLLGSNDEADVFPLAVFGFGGRNLDDAFTSLRARFEKPVALKGVVVALLEAERRHDVEAPNIDMEFVGLEGYMYEAPLEA